MWIEQADAADESPRLRLVCDGCGAAFRPGRDAGFSRSKLWHRANIAGWARIAAGPERHACVTC